MMPCDRGGPRSRIVRLPDVQAKIPDFGFEPLCDKNRTLCAICECPGRSLGGSSQDRGNRAPAIHMAPTSEDAADHQSAQTTLPIAGSSSVLIASCLSNEGKACSSKKRISAPAETGSRRAAKATCSMTGRSIFQTTSLKRDQWKQPATRRQAVAKRAL
jgi:hypothetical protein